MLSDNNVKAMGLIKHCNKQLSDYEKRFLNSVLFCQYELSYKQKHMLDRLANQYDLQGKINQTLSKSKRKRINKLMK